MYTIGIDLGGTNIVAGVVDENYRLLCTAKCKTALPREADAILDDMAALCRDVMAKVGVSTEDIAYIGIGCPGTCNTDTGEVEYSCNLAFSHVMVGPGMEQRTGLPVYIENDANAAALGETLAGAARGAKKSVCITLGTGVGAGIVLDGHIYSGANFAGGEIGHMVIVAEGEPCTCGRHGCWETYASATALIRQTRLAMEANPDSVLWMLAEGDLANVSGRTAFDAMRQGDPVGTRVVERFCGYLACGLVNVINIFQPDVLCVGGGICKEGETLLAPVRAIIEAQRYSKYSRVQTRLCVAQLGNDAGIVGAACLKRS